MSRVAIRKEAVANALVILYSDDTVEVNGRVVHDDREYKLALGLDPDTKYPHPLGWFDDWATLAVARGPCISNPLVDGDATTTT